MTAKTKTVALSPEVWEAIKSKGSMGDSFDTVLRRILGVKQ
jgi:predicted CopG family antitoxin